MRKIRKGRDSWRIWFQAVKELPQAFRSLWRSFKRNETVQYPWPLPIALAYALIGCSPLIFTLVTVFTIAAIRLF